jgi:uracil-DNA glycosylase family 4
MVGEAPGYRSWNTGRRFTGPAGVLIRRALRAIGHTRYADLEDLFYLTDVVKCHPAQRQNGASNRPPRRSEIDTCLHHLVRELEVLRPCVIVTFGKVAGEAIPKALRLAREGGTRCEAFQPEIMSFPHPSPRNQVTIRKHYPTMEAFAHAMTDAFRGLIGRLGGGPSHA